MENCRYYRDCNGLLQQISKEDAWLVLPNDRSKPAFWVRANGTLIRHWTGEWNGRPSDEDSLERDGWTQVSGPGLNCILEPYLIVDEGL